MTPVFQSGLVPVAWPRDLLFDPVARIPWVRRQFVTTLLGVRTSPVSTWSAPELARSLQAESPTSRSAVDVQPVTLGNP
jgi:hypothetical protein